MQNALTNGFKFRRLGHLFCGNGIGNEKLVLGVSRQLCPRDIISEILQGLNLKANWAIVVVYMMYQAYVMASLMKGVA